MRPHSSRTPLGRKDSDPGVFVLWTLQTVTPQICALKRLIVYAEHRSLLLRRIGDGWPDAKVAELYFGAVILQPKKTLQLAELDGRM